MVGGSPEPSDVEPARSMENRKLIEFLSEQVVEDYARLLARASHLLANVRYCSIYAALPPHAGTNFRPSLQRT
jgi:hypothetical protein